MINDNCHAGEVTRVSNKNTCDNIEIVTYFSGGKEIGREVFDENGQSLIMAGEVPDGRVIEYYWNGTCKHVFTYINNRPHGQCLTYYPEGRLLWVEQHFSHGLLDGPSRTFYRNQNPWEVCFYKKGKLNGDYKSYHENGSPDIVACYKHGKLEGECVRYSVTGTICEKSTFKKGMRDGLCITYHETEQEHCTDLYDKGEVIHRRMYDQNGTLIYDKHQPIPETEEAGAREAAICLDKGIELLSMGCHKKAVKELQLAVSEDQDFIEAYLKLAYAYRCLGRYGDYKTTLRRVLDIRPYHSEARLDIILAHIVTGNRQEAMAEYRTLQDIDAKFAKELAPMFSSYNDNPD